MLQNSACGEKLKVNCSKILFQEEDRASPIAFTVDFGGHDNLEEKNKKLERFALRSSQRKPRSPRVHTQPSVSAEQQKTRSKAKAKMTMGQPCRDDIRLPQAGTKLLLRQKSDLAKESDNSRRCTRIISPGKEVIDFSSDQRKEIQEEISRMDVKATLPFTYSGTNEYRQEKAGAEYDRDTFDCDSDDNDDIVDDKPENNSSETGTYTVDKEEEPTGFQVTKWPLIMIYIFMHSLCSKLRLRILITDKDSKAK